VPPQASPELTEARELAQRRDWLALATRLRAVPEEALLAEPELGFLFADACRHVGDTTRALAVGRAVDVAARRTGDRWLVVNVVNLMGMTLFEAGRMADAEARFEELLECSTDWGDEDYAARAANGLGALANVRGRRDLALTQYQRAIAGYTRVGNQRGLAQTHYNLGLSFRDLDLDADADAHFRRAIEFAVATGTEEVIALAEVERANLRVRAGDGELGGEMARLALERFRRIADPTGAAQAIRILGLAARAAGRVAEARARLGEALELAIQHSDVLLRAEVQRDRGLLFRDGGDVAAAREALADSAAQFAEIGAAAEAEAIRILLDALRD
jgi:tetratricopeptide (TPR) repeat protein